jgi:serine/threonine protein kinase
VKISDFGLSCLAKDEDALEHISLLWTSPEIFAGEKFTQKSDVYRYYFYYFNIVIDFYIIISVLALSCGNY